MGATNGKIAPCPFNQLEREKRQKAKSMRFIPGEASAFYFLCKNGKIDEVRQILDDETSPPIDELNQLQPNGSTPLHVATYYNHLEIVKLLLEHDCSRTTLNRYGKTANEEAQTDEMKEIFMRPTTTNRFHETNTADAISMFFPEEDIEGVNASRRVNYVHLFRTDSEIFEYSLNQQTTAMWLNFYNWFFHKFRPLTERDEFHIDAFDLDNHLDFQEFLKRNLSDPNKYTKTMKFVTKSKQRNSIEPLITLYTSENAGFYRSFNRLLAQSSPNPEMSPHLCDRFLVEFHMHREELQQRAFTGTLYRGATIAANDLAIYRHALGIQPLAVIGFKSFSSTSKDPFVALKFALQTPANEGQKHVLFIYEIPEVTSTIFGISDISEYRHEQEVLILPGNLFIVTKIQEQTNMAITKIYLTHINVPISFGQKIRHTIRSGRKSVL